MIQSKIEKNPPPEFDLEFFKRFNDFILYLRNSTTHKGRFLTDLERFKADLSVKMSFPFIEFYTEIVYPVLSEGESAKEPLRIKPLSSVDVDPSEIIYYGLDGDNTGAILEELFVSSSDETRFRKLSASVASAVSSIAKFVRRSAGKASVVFEAGDDLLFKGRFSENKLREMQRIYSEVTEGLTCSIGYGRSFQEVYLALKLAKTEPRKNSIVGIQFD